MAILTAPTPPPGPRVSTAMAVLAWAVLHDSDEHLAFEAAQTLAEMVLEANQPTTQ